MKYYLKSYKCQGPCFYFNFKDILRRNIIQNLAKKSSNNSCYALFLILFFISMIGLELQI